MKALRNIVRDKAAQKALLNFINQETCTYDVIDCVFDVALAVTPIRAVNAALQTPVQYKERMLIFGHFKSGKPTRKFVIETETGVIISDRNYSPFAFIKLITELGYEIV